MCVNFTVEIFKHTKEERKCVDRLPSPNSPLPLVIPHQRKLPRKQLWLVLVISLAHSEEPICGVVALGSWSLGKRDLGRFVANRQSYACVPRLGELSSGDPQACSTPVCQYCGVVSPWPGPLSCWGTSLFSWPSVPPRPS